MLRLDQEVFTKILGNNPIYVLSALRTWAYAWSKGEPSEEELDEQDGIDTLPVLVAEKLARGRGLDTTMGGQHLPDFLRHLADRIEDGQIAELRKAVAVHGPEIIKGMGRKLEALYANPPIRLVEDKEATEKLRASAAHLRRKPKA